MAERITVVGLSYVGPPVAVGLARHFDSVGGFDINAKRLDAVRDGVDVTREFTADKLAGLDVNYVDDTVEPADCHR